MKKIQAIGRWSSEARGICVCTNPIILMAGLKSIFLTYNSSNFTVYFFVPYFFYNFTALTSRVPFCRVISSTQGNRNIRVINARSFLHLWSARPGWEAQHDPDHSYALIRYMDEELHNIKYCEALTAIHRCTESVRVESFTFFAGWTGKVKRIGRLGTGLCYALSFFPFQYCGCINGTLTLKLGPWARWCDAPRRNPKDAYWGMQILIL